MRIGLTFTGNPEKHQYYVDWLKGNENLEIIRLSAENNSLEELGRCDALVLSGGIDIHPRFYGSSKLDYERAPEKFNEKRDEFEIAAFHAAQDKHLPVLGICRGMQLINVILGGTMMQNLPSEQLINVHIGNPDKTHKVSVTKNSLLYLITENETAQVNSAHHQTIDKLGIGLMINAKSDEGLIEGLEWENRSDNPFMLAVQWHPERMFRFQLENTNASHGIRERFIEEIKKSIALKK